MSTPHNAATVGQIAESVLLPGDPLRARYVAEHFLEDAEQVTGIRNMLGFTGTWKGRRVSVMGSGMGGPSIGIYSYELFSVYGVQQIVRIGTAGGLQSTLNVGDLVLAMTASPDSNWAYQYRLPGTYSPCADFGLLEKAVAAARGAGIRCHVGGVFSSDLFSSYNALGSRDSWEPWARMGCIAQDMETYALYCTAAWLGKKALSVLTHTDSCVSGEGLQDGERMSALHSMFEIALEVCR
jgi:purine-nucleoside phosphorylase